MLSVVKSIIGLFSSCMLDGYQRNQFHDTQLPPLDFMCSWSTILEMCTSPLLSLQSLQFSGRLNAFHSPLLDS